MAVTETLQQSIDRVYDAFAGYPAPRPSICDQCAPGLTADEFDAIGLRSLSFSHLGGVHVMSLDDDALRFYVPRLAELLLRTPAAVFDFRPGELKQRMVGWPAAERGVIRQLAQAVWAELPSSYPADLGYFSDCPSAVDFLDWCELPLKPALSELVAAGGEAAARHVADLVDAVFTRRDPFETASATAVLESVRESAVGDCLQEAFFATNSAEVAQHLSAAHELWSVCR